MKRSGARRALLILAAIAGIAAPSRAQRPGAVPIDDPIYSTIDRLAASGLIDTIVVGQRPYSRREVARLLDKAQRNARDPRRGSMSTSARSELDSIATRFLDEPRGVLDAIVLTAASTNEPARRIPSDTGLGGVDAVIAPLAIAAAPGAGDAMRGGTLVLETLHHLTIGNIVSLDVQPRFRASSSASVTGSQTVSLRMAVLSARMANVDVSLGRENLEWGQGRLGGLFFSQDSPPLDMVRLTTDRPWVPPRPFAFIGPSALSFVVADLGADQYFPHTKLIAYKWSAEPTPRLELGVGALDFVGGRGAPPASAGKAIENLFLFPVLPTQGYQFSNTMAGLEARYHLSELGGARLYWEMNLDDFDFHRIRSSAWTDDAAHLFGLAIPPIASAGGTAFTLEAHHTGTRFGRHLQFQSGAADHQLLLGDPLGPNASGEYAFANWGLGGHHPLELELANETYSNDQHTITQPPFVIHLIESRPLEHRQRILAAMRNAPLANNVLLTLQAGAERIEHFAFTPRDSRMSGLASASVRYMLR